MKLSDLVNLLNHLPGDVEIDTSGTIETEIFPLVSLELRFLLDLLDKKPEPSEG